MVDQDNLPRRLEQIKPRDITVTCTERLKRKESRKFVEFFTGRLGFFTSAAPVPQIDYRAAGDVLERNENGTLCHDEGLTRLKRQLYTKPNGEKQNTSTFVDQNLYLAFSPKQKNQGFFKTSLQESAILDAETVKRSI